MMTELFYQDAYIRSFTAEVLSCTEGKNGYEVILSDTAFYPEGGGQPADHGTLNGIKVIDVRTKDGVITHITEAPLEVNTEVRGEIDWERRFDHMQNHSGEHIVSGLIHRKYGYENVGFHLGPEEILIDFDGFIDEAGITEIENAANDIIMRNLTTNIFFPSEEERKSIPYRSKKELTGVVRLVEFPEADLCACCGTHVKQTGEIGLVKITSSEKHKNGTRLHLLCGKRALRNYQIQAAQNAEISHLLSVKVHETAAAVERLKNENGRLMHTVNTARKELLSIKASDFPKDGKFLLTAEENLDGNILREYVNELKAVTNTETIAVLSVNEGSVGYVIISDSIDLRAKAKELNEAFKGRGGGKPEMIQGTWNDDIDVIKKELPELLQK